MSNRRKPVNKKTKAIRAKSNVNNATKTNKKRKVNIAPYTVAVACVGMVAFSSAIFALVGNAHEHIEDKKIIKDSQIQITQSLSEPVEKENYKALMGKELDEELKIRTGISEMDNIKIPQATYHNENNEIIEFEESEEKPEEKKDESKASDKKSEEKKDESKASDKKSEEKKDESKASDKKSEEKKDESKASDKKSEEKKDENKASDKKSEEKKDESKASDKKSEEKKDENKASDKKSEEKKDESKPADKKSEDKKPESKPVAVKPVVDAKPEESSTNDTNKTQTVEKGNAGFNPESVGVTGAGNISAWKKKNSDVVGWLKIPNTNINYPVVMNDDNLYYNDKGYYKEYSKNGVIWGDCWNKLGNSDEISRNNIIYGHNWTNYTADPKIGRAQDVMFAQLTAFHHLSFAQKTPYIHYSTEDEAMTWKVFAAFYTEMPIDYLIQNDSNDAYMRNMIKEAKARSLHEYSVDVDEDDKILTMITCTRAYGKTANQRFVVMARLMRPGEKIEEVEIKAHPNFKKPNIRF